MFLIFTVFLFVGFVPTTIQENEKYGKFDLIVNDFNTCKGPKVVNCTKFVVGIINSTTVYVNITILKPVRLKKGKILMKVNGKDLVRMQMTNPCTHLFIGQVLMTYYKMSKDCLIQNGTYYLFFDINKMATEYYGGAFVYGNITFTSILNGDECNFICTALDVAIQPKSRRKT